MAEEGAEKKRVLVTGASGLLGREVVRAFKRRDWAVTGAGYYRADGVNILECDLGDALQVAKLLDVARPQVVIHCAAQRFPDKVDADPDAARRLNVDATATLARLCAQRGAVMVYISTDYVFPGEPGAAPYEAGEHPGPTNLYGETKLEGEQELHEAYAAVEKRRGGKAGRGRGVVLRVPVLYGHAEVPAESAVNVLMDVVWDAQKEDAKVVKMDHWAKRYPTNTEDVGRVCVDVAEKWMSAPEDEEMSLGLQFSSEDCFTKYEICKVFGEIMGLDIGKIEPNAEGNDPNASVQRPYDCHLSTESLKLNGIDVSTQDFVGWWRREVRAFRK